MKHTISNSITFLSTRRVALAVSVLGLLAAMFMASASAQGFARGYATNDQGLKNGMVVTFSNTSTPDKPYVERATREDIQKVIGVTTTSEDNLLTIASAEQEVYVQNSGVVSVLTSDVNGDIKKGDKLTLSPLKGILMRGDDVNPIIGSAVADFSKDNAESQTVSTDSGEKTVLVNKLEVTIDGGLIENQVGNNSSALQKIGKSVTGKDVGELQVIIAMVIFLSVLIAEGSIVYGAVSSGIISMGRNPMAQKVVSRELVRVLGIAVVVLFVGLAAVYTVMSV
ncbi:MAG: hypothetical protein ACR2FM_05765 [Candidatus Saccharimonadales bacterium]